MGKQNDRGRCGTCVFLNYDVPGRIYERGGPQFCGLHGRERVYSDKMGIDSCRDYLRRVKARQLELFN